MGVGGAVLGGLRNGEYWYPLDAMVPAALVCGQCGKNATAIYAQGPAHRNTAKTRSVHAACRHMHFDSQGAAGPVAQVTESLAITIKKDWLEAPQNDSQDCLWEQCS